MRDNVGYVQKVEGSKKYQGDHWWCCFLKILDVASMILLYVSYLIPILRSILSFSQALKKVTYIQDAVDKI